MLIVPQFVQYKLKMCANVVLFCAQLIYVRKRKFQKCAQTCFHLLNMFYMFISFINQSINQSTQSHCKCLLYRQLASLVNINILNEY